MKKSYASLSLLVLLLSQVFTGCSLFKPRPQIEQKGPHIRGEVAHVTSLENGNVVLQIEGQIEADTKYDKARVTVTKETEVFIKNTKGYQIGDRNNLAVGQTVEALFAGPIQESYPVGATASEVIIINSDS